MKVVMALKAGFGVLNRVRARPKMAIWEAIDGAHSVNWVRVLSLCEWEDRGYRGDRG